MAPINNPKLTAFLAELRSSPDSNFLISHYHYLPAQEGVSGAPSQDLSPPLQAALAELGIKQLYSHQATALDALNAGKHILVATPTASGKTLIYNVPVIQSLLRNRAAAPSIFFRSRPWNRTS